jgi:hypothetical protein
MRGSPCSVKTLVHSFAVAKIIHTQMNADRNGVSDIAALLSAGPRPVTIQGQ